DALEEYVRDWSRQTGISADVRAQGRRSTPLGVEQAVYRVVQEALANVARHSGATAVDIDLAWESNSLALEVTDNGRGFAIGEAIGKGIGLTSMRERFETLGGTLSVESSTAGTRVSARVRT